MNEAGHEPDSDLMHRSRFWNRCIFLSAIGLCVGVAIAAGLYIKKMLDVFATLSGSSEELVEDELAGDLSVLDSVLTIVIVWIALLLVILFASVGRFIALNKRAKALQDGANADPS